MRFEILVALEAVAAAVAIVVLWRSKRTPGAPPAGSWTAGEAGAWAAMMASAIAIRFHALELVPREWIGETWSHVAASTDLVSAARRAFGEEPVISQGFVWYLIEHVWVRLFGPSFAAGRVLSALVSVLAVAALHAFLRRVAGREIALLGAALFAFSPLEVDWSRDEFLFPYAEIYAIALAHATFAAGESPRRRTLFLLAAGIGLGSLVYPAARLLGLLPFVYLPLRRRREEAWPTERRRIAGALAAGGALFLLAPFVLRWIAFGRPGPLTPLEVDSGLGVRTASGVVANAGWLLRSLFVETHVFRWWEVTTSSLPPRTLVSPFVAAFLVAGLVAALRRRTSRDLLLVLWLLLALLPFLPAAIPAARRLACAFPAITALAAIAAVDVFRALARDPDGRRARFARAGVFTAIVAAEAFVRSSLFFGRTPGRPPVHDLARALVPALTPGTLVVTDLKYEYKEFFEGKLFLELYDDVLRVPDVAVFAARNGALFPDPESIRYRGAALSALPERDQVRLVFAVTDAPVFLGEPASLSRITRVLYVLRNSPEEASLLDEIRKRHPAAREVLWPLGPPGCGGVVLVDATARD